MNDALWTSVVRWAQTFLVLSCLLIGLTCIFLGVRLWRELK